MKSKFACSLFAVFLFGLTLHSTDAFASDEAAQQPGALEVGSTFAPYTLEDQFRKQHTLSENTKRVIISSEMDLSKQMHTWLNDNDPSYLKNNDIEYVADISEMPGIITYLFARPKMQKYPFQILLADEDDKFDSRFPRQAGKLAVFDLTAERKVGAIHYVESMEQVTKLPPPSSGIIATNFADYIRSFSKAAKASTN